MRRDFDLIREILLAVGDKDVTNSVQLMAETSRGWDVTHYHLGLLVNEAKLLHGEYDDAIRMGSIGPKDPDEEPHWSGLSLTWEGNDFLDAIDDDKAWKRVQKAMKSGASTTVLEALKEVGKTAVKLGAAAVILEAEEGNKLETDVEERGEVRGDDLPQNQAGS